MGNFRIIKCNNQSCDFWQDGICLYGGTALTIPNSYNDEDCPAYESYENDSENE